MTAVLMSLGAGRLHGGPGEFLLSRAWQHIRELRRSCRLAGVSITRRPRHDDPDDPGRYAYG